MVTAIEHPALLAARARAQGVPKLARCQKCRCTVLLDTAEQHRTQCMARLPRPSAFGRGSAAAAVLDADKVSLEAEQLCSS